MQYHLEDQEKDRLLEWEQSQQQTVPMTLIPSDHEETPLFETFCKTVEQHSSRIKQLKESDQQELPGIALLNNRLIFHALPRGKVFFSFLDVLSLAAVAATSVSSPPPSLSPTYSSEMTESLNLSPETAANLSRIEVPVKLKLYIANQCPHCPGVVATILPLAASCSHIHVKVIDGTLFPNHASKDNVLSAPCLILDDDFRWTGSVTPEEVTSMIVNRNPSALSTASLRGILEDGKADWIARQMMDQNTIFPGFTGLVIHEIWSVRLGAMVVLEELTEKTPELAVQIGPKILKHFQDADTPTKGDILYALGETGDQGIKQEILDLMDGLKEPDLVEAAQEAVEAIEARA